MRVLVYPADETGCGYHRLAWPAEVLRAEGSDVRVVAPRDRQLKINMRADDTVHSVEIEEGVDVFVLQRITHRWLVDVVRALRERGVAVVIDVDDDLTSIHPGNMAFDALHPRNDGTRDVRGRAYMHSWQNLSAACREATLVTVATPGLVPVYGSHGRVAVLSNYLADHYYGVPHADSDMIGWPASLHTHPNDPEVVGPAVARLVDRGVAFHVIADPAGVGRAFGLPTDPPGSGVVDLPDWPRAVSQLGIGIAPLADTRFNASKSWLKPLEMSAVGVPWVGSPRHEYVALHGYGAGVLVDRPRDWYHQLRRLVDEPAWRAELAERGRYAAVQLRLRDNAWRWLEAWDLALRIQRGELTRAPGAARVSATR